MLVKEGPSRFITQAKTTEQRYMKSIIDVEYRPESAVLLHASIHKAVRRLTAKSHEVSKPRDWML